MKRIRQERVTGSGRQQRRQNHRPRWKSNIASLLSSSSVSCCCTIMAAGDHQHRRRETGSTNSSVEQRGWCSSSLVVVVRRLMCFLCLPFVVNEIGLILLPKDNGNSYSRYLSSNSLLLLDRDDRFMTTTTIQDQIDNTRTAATQQETMKQLAIRNHREETVVDQDHYRNDHDKFDPTTADNNESKNTIVTAFYTLPTNRHSQDEYFNDLLPKLFSVEDPMIIFTSPDLVPRIQELRGDDPTKQTMIIPLPLGETKVAKMFSSAVWRQVAYHTRKRNRVEHRQVFWIWLAKMEFLKRGSDLNPFGSNFFAWVDAGMIRWPEYTNTTILQRIPPELPPNKFLILNVTRITHKSKNVMMGGQLFGGYKEGIDRFYERYQETLLKCGQPLKEGGEQEEDLDTILTRAMYLSNDQKVLYRTCVDNINTTDSTQSLCLPIRPERRFFGYGIGPIRYPMFFMLPFLNNKMYTILKKDGLIQTTFGDRTTEYNEILEKEPPLTLPKDGTTHNHPTLSESKFTPHVHEILRTIDEVTLHLPENATSPWWYQPQKYCPQGYHIYVDKPYSPPTAIECHPTGVWCDLLQLLFANGKRVLPYNVSIGISNTDMIKKGSMGWGQCLGSSGPDGGLFSMNNFQNAKIVVAGMQAAATALASTTSTARDDTTTTTDYNHVHTKTWEERHKIPIFRGRARVPVRGPWERFPESRCSKMTVEKGDFGHRAKAVLFSLEYPELLDARVSKVEHPCLSFNGATNNELRQVAGTGIYSRSNENIEIPSSQYYTDYQTVVVLGGNGAACRTSEHLAAGQAVVLQRYTFEEWFYPYMTPYVHYIPIKNDLSDMQEALEFVRDNPEKVKEIAQNGKKFYEDWLSVARTADHWHELLWRLSEMIHEKGPERLKTGTARTIWPAPFIPKRYIRNDDDTAESFFILEDNTKTRQPYWEVDGPPETREMCKQRPGTDWCD